MTEKKLTTNQELGETSYHKKEEKMVSIYERYCVQFYYYKNVFKKYDSYSEHFFVRVIQSNLLQV